MESRWTEGQAHGRGCGSSPDLVHLHHVWPAADRYLSMLARAAGVPHLVVTEHIMGESHSRGQRALKRDELQNADAVTAVTGAIVDTLVRDYAIERSLVRVVPNGADLPDDDREQPLARGWRERFLTTPRQAAVGRGRPASGSRRATIALLFEALASLVRRGSTSRWSGEARAPAGSSSALSLGLRARVQFVG